MPDFIGTLPGGGLGGIDPHTLSPIAGDPAIMGAIHDAEERGRAGSGTGTGGAPAVDPNAWAQQAIDALNNAEQLLKDLTVAISTTGGPGLDAYGYHVGSTGTSGDTLAAAFVSTKVQSITGGVTENAMTAARRAQEIQKKVWG
ncbi:hypothetical protein HZC35_04410 [Candidatus Saganbacteria bacterium]|nr:hypothetical protein [Candidatus Saganbacteria bacterium]